MAINRRNETHNPNLLVGDLSVDDRGEVGFVNDFDMKSVKRFYSVSNHRAGMVRAWHAHKKEKKFVTVVNGAAIIAAVCIDNWQKPSKDLQIFRYVLSAKKPTVLFIPNGYANGFLTLTEDSKLIFFSSATLEESMCDDFRYKADYWNPWDISER
tara:strand:+ start:262 stop:726 length:465 start_codon:yes stop_codon:yes gene_type:complete